MKPRRLSLLRPLIPLRRENLELLPSLLHENFCRLKVPIPKYEKLSNLHTHHFLVSGHGLISKLQSQLQSDFGFLPGDYDLRNIFHAPHNQSFFPFFRIQPELINFFERLSEILAESRIFFPRSFQSANFSSVLQRFSRICPRRLKIRS